MLPAWRGCVVVSQNGGCDVMEPENADDFAEYNLQGT
jgi:hypothetical protein